LHDRAVASSWEEEHQEAYQEEELQEALHDRAAASSPEVRLELEEIWEEQYQEAVLLVVPLGNLSTHTMC
jgi:hypothetical protein